MSQNGSHRMSAPLRRFGAWLAALALAIQVFVVQPHVHLTFAAAPQAVEAHAGAATDNLGHSPDARDHFAAYCALCHAFARATSLAASEPPALDLIAHAPGNAPSPIIAHLRELRAHHWLSRGPPFL